MAVPATGAVLLLTAVFGDRGIVIVGFVRLTVSDSGKLALMVIVPVLEFNWAAAGAIDTANAIATNIMRPRTDLNLLVIFNLPLCFFRTFSMSVLTATPGLAR